MYDAIGLGFGIHYNQEVKESLNPNAKKFYDLLHVAQKPLWLRCVDHTELFVAVRLLIVIDS